MPAVERPSPGGPPAGVRLDRSFYGRQKGRPLRPQQAERLERLLPELRIDLESAPPKPLTCLFSRPVGEVWLEIGFGSGEHLVHHAQRQPEVGFIGVEPFINGHATLLERVEQLGLSNVRVLDYEVAPLLNWLPERSLARVFVLYPDPWPKRRHQKRRLISPANLRRLARVMQPGADLQIATDIEGYAATSLAAALGSDDFTWLAAGREDWRRPFPDWPGTRYERKAVAAGRRPIYLTFRRR
ncbi:MAG: tRNA (guanosine(46)-N(7))-methyltransferase TrmB [Hyphomicrobiaceae bacterium]